MKKNLLIISFLLWVLWIFSTQANAQTEESPKPQSEVGEHNDSKQTTSDDNEGGGGKKRKKKNKNLDALVEGKTQEDLEESNKVALTKEEKDYLKKKEKQKKAQKKIDDATRKRTEKIISKRQKKAKKKVTGSKKTYLKTH